MKVWKMVTSSRFRGLRWHGYLNSRKANSWCLRNRKHFPCLLHTVICRNTSESLGEREIEVGTQARRVVPRYFEFSQTFTSLCITYYKITLWKRELWLTKSRVPHFPCVLICYRNTRESLGELEIASLWRLLWLLNDWPYKFDVDSTVDSFSAMDNKKPG